MIINSKQFDDLLLFKIWKFIDLWMDKSSFNYHFVMYAHYNPVFKERVYYYHQHIISICYCYFAGSRPLTVESASVQMDPRNITTYSIWCVLFTLRVYYRTALHGITDTIFGGQIERRWMSEWNWRVCQNKLNKTRSLFFTVVHVIFVALCIRLWLSLVVISFDCGTNYTTRNAFQWTSLVCTVIGVEFHNLVAFPRHTALFTLPRRVPFTPSCNLFPIHQLLPAVAWK